MLAALFHTTLTLLVVVAQLGFTTQALFARRVAMLEVLALELLAMFFTLAAAGAAAQSFNLAVVVALLALMAMVALAAMQLVSQTPKVVLVVLAMLALAAAARGRVLVVVALLELNLETVMAVAAAVLAEILLLVLAAALAALTEVVVVALAAETLALGHKA
jgi:hypothetical protein